MIAPELRLTLGRRAASLAALAAGHAALVGWVAWYVVDAAWGSVPVSASLTPVPRAAFTIPWVAGTVFLLGAAPIVGASAARGGWVGPDPTAALPIGRGAHAAAAWVASIGALALVALGPLPVYVALHALGALAAPALAGYAVAQAAVVVAAPLPGIAVALGAPRGARR